MLSRYIILVLNDKMYLVEFGPNILATHMHRSGHSLPLNGKENCMI